jgi:preprotein translocase subunit SecE
MTSQRRQLTRTQFRVILVVVGVVAFSLVSWGLDRLFS